MKSFFNWLIKFEFETILGPFAVWGAASVLFCGCIVLQAMEWMRPVVVCVRLLWLGASLGVFVAFINALVEKRFGTAILQFFLGLLCLFGFAICFVFANMAGWSTAHRISTGPNGWAASEMTEQIPFSVEFKPVHPFLAEYDKRIVFRSGKRFGVWKDTGGGGSFAVYALGEGEYYLADGLDCDFMRNDYRLNVTNETVEMNVNGVWLKIPEGAESIIGRGSDLLSVKTATGEEKTVTALDGKPLRRTLDGRKFLGFICPNGKFEASTDDPFAGEEGRRRMGHEIDWKPCKLGDEVPFDIEDGEKSGECYRRIRLKGGKTLMLEHRLYRRIISVIFRLGPNEYNIVEDWEQEERWERNYRINVSNETIDVEFDGTWIRLPEGALFVESMGRRGKDEKAVWTVKVQTDDGLAEGHEAFPAGDYKKHRKLIGTLSRDGEFYLGAASER